MKNAVFWALTPCGYYKNSCFRGILSVNSISSQLASGASYCCYKPEGRGFETR
jgi:hypothetical protein